MTSQHSSISPTANTTDVVFAADGGLEAEMDEEELKDLFSDEAEAPLLQPSVEDRGLADGTEGLTATEEDLEGAVHKILPDPGEPTAAEVEDHGHVDTFLTEAGARNASNPVDWESPIEHVLSSARRACSPLTTCSLVRMGSQCAVMKLQTAEMRWQ